MLCVDFIIGFNVACVNAPHRPCTLQYRIFVILLHFTLFTPYVIFKDGSLVRNRSQTELTHCTVCFAKHLATRVIITKLQLGCMLLLDTQTRSHLPGLLQGSKWESDWR